jgi:hypothetical protein
MPFWKRGYKISLITMVKIIIATPKSLPGITLYKKTNPLNKGRYNISLKINDIVDIL